MASAEKPPRWAGAVQQLLAGQAAVQLFTQSPGGLLVVNRDKHTFAVTFGHAWQKLQDEWLEREFGRRVALNTIADEGIVEIRSEQVFARWHVASDRAPKAKQRLVLFTPTYRRDDSLAVESYVFGRLVKDPARIPYLTVDSWLNYLDGAGESPSVSQAKATKIHLLDGEHEELKACSVFDCFGCEVSRAGLTFVLSSGVWYKVVEEFLSKVNTAILKIPKPKISLPAWNRTESEGQYNERCGAIKSFLHFDEKLVHFGGAQSKFEFCDLLHPESNTMVFAKIVSKSSGMSHLVEQVRRTAELCFAVDSGYRTKLSNAFKKHYPKSDRKWLDARPKPSDFNLCLVSLGRPAKAFPFFAKCGLVTLYRELTDRGHNVSMADV